MRRATAGTLVALASLLTLPGVAQERRPSAPGPPATLEEMDTTGRLDDLQSAVEAAINKVVRAKRSQCLRAFGDPDFCTCLSEELPVGASFANYVRVVTTAKEDLAYAGLSKDDKQAVDNIIAAREACVRKAYEGRRR